MSSQPPQSHLPSPCPHCQGQRIWATTHAAAGGYGGDFDLIYTNRPFTLFSSRKRAKLVAAICLHCGYTAFYTKGVEKIRDEFQQHPEKFLRDPSL